mgnify:CR=1 FL=1
MAVLLGIDFGAKRIGIAVTDESGSMAFPFGCINFKSRKQVLAELQKIIKEYKAVKIVAGLPKTLKGEIGPAAEKIMKHVDWFRSQMDIPWDLSDERMSTAEVERVLLDADVRRDKRKEVRDQLAAQRILQVYLDIIRNGPENG